MSKFKDLTGQQFGKLTVLVGLCGNASVNAVEKKLFVWMHWLVAEQKVVECVTMT